MAQANKRISASKAFQPKKLAKPKSKSITKPSAVAVHKRVSAKSSAQNGGHHVWPQAASANSGVVAPVMPGMKKAERAGNRALTIEPQNSVRFDQAGRAGPISAPVNAADMFSFGTPWKSIQNPMIDSKALTAAINGQAQFFGAMMKFSPFNMMLQGQTMLAKMMLDMMRSAMMGNADKVAAKTTARG